MLFNLGFWVFVRFQEWEWKVGGAQGGMSGFLVYEDNMFALVFQDDDDQLVLVKMKMDMSDKILILK